MANRYWVGGTGNWDTTTNWSTTSGGASGASAPSATDDVIIDDNSHSGADFQITVRSNLSTNECLSIDTTALTSYGVTMYSKRNVSGSGELYVYGDFTAGSELTFDGDLYSSYAYFMLIMTGSTTIDFSTVNGTDDLFLNIYGGTGTITLGGDITFARLDIASGNTLTTNNYNITISNEQAAASWFRAYNGAYLNLGSSTVDVLRFDASDSTGRIDYGTSTVKAYATSMTVYPGNNPYNLTLKANVLAGWFTNPTFNGGTFTVDNNLVFEYGDATDKYITTGTNTSITVGGSISRTGTAELFIGRLNNSGTAVLTLTSSTGYHFFDNIDIEYNTATGGATFQADNSTFGTSVSGWMIPPALTDNFDDNSLSASWYEYEGGSATNTETNTQLEQALPSSATSSDYAGIENDITSYDMTRSYYHVEVEDVVNASTNANQAFVVYDSAGSSTTNSVRWLLENGTLYAQKYVATTKTTVGSVAFNASTHKWWRIREENGTNYWDTSEDGQTWTNRYSNATGITVTAVNINLEASCYQNETDPGTAIWDNFSIEAPVQIVTDDASFIFALDNATIQSEVTLEPVDITMGAMTIENTTLQAKVIFDPNDIIFSFSTEGTTAGVDYSRNKTYRYKIYDKADNYIMDWNDVVSDLSFSHEINTAGTQAVVSLARNLDATGEELDLKFGNVVKIYVDDRETRDTLVFQGSIVNITPSYSETDSLDVTLFSRGADLDHILYRTNESLEQSQDTNDAEVIIGPDSTIAQSFIPDQPSITSVEFKMKTEVDVANVTLEIQTDSGGNPSGTAVTGATSVQQVVNTSTNTIKFVFDETVTVTTPATTYWLVVSAE